jgi:hypothetical protein
LLVDLSRVIAMALPLAREQQVQVLETQRLDSPELAKECLVQPPPDARLVCFHHREDDPSLLSTVVLIPLPRSIAGLDRAPTEEASREADYRRVTLHVVVPEGAPSATTHSVLAQLTYRMDRTPGAFAATLKDLVWVDVTEAHSKWTLFFSCESAASCFTRVLTDVTPADGWTWKATRVRCPSPLRTRSLWA